MNADLARLALRRALPAVLVLPALLLAALVVRAAWQPDAAAQAALGDSGDAAALARAGTWAALLTLVTPWLVAVAAGLPRRWRAGEVEWLARAVRGPLAVVGSLWVGLVLAAGLAIGAVALAGELAAARRPARPSGELTARFGVPAALLVPGGAPLQMAFDPGPLAPGARARVHLVFLGGGPSLDVRATCALESGLASAPSQLARVSSGHALEFELEPGQGARRLVLEHAGGEGAVQLSTAGLEVVMPLEDVSALAVRFALRVWVLLAALLAVALGAGAWMGATTSFGLCAALLLAALLSGGAPARWLPSAGLGDAFEWLGQGLTGPLPGLRAWAGTAASVVLGLALAARGLVRWRSAAR